MNLVKLKNNNLFKLISKKKIEIFLFFLFIFSIYSALTIGKSWDENFHLLQGKVTLDYLFSLGKIDNYILYRENFSPLYGSLKFLIIQIFPSKYQFEINHLINLFFSISTIIGLGKLCKELFNKKLSKIVFLILFFYPVFFGHMAFNNKDMILAFCHVWIFYIVIRYFKKQNIKEKINNYTFLLGLLVALATGVQLAFLGSLIPIFFFVIFEVFFLKKIIINNFNIKKLLIDFLKIFFIFYFFLVLFWIDTHSNIITLPTNFLFEHYLLVSGSEWRGWPFNLFNGEYYIAKHVPNLYFLISLIYKSPEYFLISYLFFIIIIFTSTNFFTRNFTSFFYKLTIIISFMLTSVLIGFLVPLKYDGIRHILWAVPYFSIIPGLTIYYLIENFNSFKSKLLGIFLIPFVFYFLFNFFLMTPYQYTYLNFLSGKSENRYKKFENDYWGASINELVSKIDLNKGKKIKFSGCGINKLNAEIYLKNMGYQNFVFVNPEESDYIIMTNRAVRLSSHFTQEYSKKDNKIVKLINCFDKFKGKNIFKVERNGILLSTIRKNQEVQ